jgi:5-methylcytosine-specific restriction endonuclease McrA
MKNHPDKRRDHERKREIKKKGIPGFHSEEEWVNLVELCDYTCVFCGERFSLGELTRDHIIPITIAGSSDYIENIQPACGVCNSKKGNRESVDRRPKSPLSILNV